MNTALSSRTTHIRLWRALSVARLARFSVLLVFFIVLIRTAWTCDDSFITLRVVDNLANGYGPVWNTDERVQAYTHPLWMLLLSTFYFVTREPYYTTLAISAVLSIAAVILVLRVTDSASLILLAGISLVGSKAFVDFSTSGLENPLSHLLLVIFSVAYLRTRRQESVYGNNLIAIAAGLIILNRMDLALFVLPAIAERLLREKTWPGRLRYALIVFGPTVGWMMFSLFYYGFPLPNTFYAKQSANIPRQEYLVRGIAYFVDLLVHDPLTAAVIALGTALAAFSRTCRGLRALALGTLAYSAYVIWAGGDFMRGRFFSAALVVSVVCLVALLARTSLKPGIAMLGLGAMLGLSVLAQPVPTWLSGYPYTRAEFRPPDSPIIHFTARLLHRPDFPQLASHIIDERGFYYLETGLLPQMIDGATLERSYLAESGINLRRLGTRVTSFGVIGFSGFYGGPQLKIVDHNALADAFLARLPPYGGTMPWRIGHIVRRPPDGYITTRLYGQNALSDPQLRMFYDHLSVVIQGPLLSLQRFDAIARLNLHPPIIDLEAMRHPARDFSRLQFSAQVVPIPSEGVTIYMDAAHHPLPQGILLLTDKHTSYILEIDNEWGDASSKLSFILTPTVIFPHAQYATHLVELADTPRLEYSLLRLTPMNKTTEAAAGQLRILDETLSWRSERLVKAGLVLSAATGLLTPIMPPPLIDRETMAGVWWSEEPQAYELSVSLSSTNCSRQVNSNIVLSVNKQRVATFPRRPDTCRQDWDSNLRLDATLIKRGWNLVEIYVDAPYSISVNKIQPRPVRER